MNLYVTIVMKLIKFIMNNSKINIILLIEFITLCILYVGKLLRKKYLIYQKLILINI